MPNRANEHARDEKDSNVSRKKKLVRKDTCRHFTEHKYVTEVNQVHTDDSGRQFS